MLNLYERDPLGVFFLYRSTPETALNVAQTLLGRPCDFFGQKRALQGRHEVRKPEVGQVLR